MSVLADKPRTKLTELLPLAFYALLLLAFGFATSDLPGWGMLLLIAAGAAHVLRVGVEELPGVEARQASRRLRSVRAAPQRSPEVRRSRRTRRAGATTGRARTAGSPRVSPPTPPAARAR